MYMNHFKHVFNILIYICSYMMCVLLNVYLYLYASIKDQLYHMVKANGNFSFYHSLLVKSREVTDMLQAPLGNVSYSHY